MTLISCAEWFETQAEALTEKVVFIFGMDDPAESDAVSYQFAKVGETPVEFFDFERRIHEVYFTIYIDNALGWKAQEQEFETHSKYILDWVYDDPTLGGNCVCARHTGWIEVELPDNSPLQSRVLTLEIETNL